MSIKGLFPIDKWDLNLQSILSGLPESDIDLLLHCAAEHTYIKGQMVFKEGAEPTGIFYIREGKVKKYKVDNFGKEQIIYVANAGELIGYHAILASEPYPDSASVLEKSVIQYITKEHFLTAIDQSPYLSKRLLKILSHEFGVLVNNVSVFSRPVRERMAIALIVLREKFKCGTEEDQPVVINVSREDIASMVGTTRENVVRILRQFKDEKIVETKGRKICVLNIHGLVQASNLS